MQYPMQYLDSTPCSTRTVPHAGTPCQHPDSTPCHPHPCARIHTRQLPELERDLGGSKGGTGERGKDGRYILREADCNGRQ